MAGIVFDAGAVPHFLHHFQVVVGPLFQPLGFQELSLVPKLLQPAVQFLFNGTDGFFQLVRTGDIVGRRENTDMVPLRHCFSGKHIEFRERIHFVPKHFNPNSHIIFRSRKYINRISPHPESVSGEIHIIPHVLHIHQFFNNLVPIDFLSRTEGQAHGTVVFRIPQTIDAGHRGYDDDILPFKEGHGGRMTQPVDFFIPGGILFYIGIRLGYIGFGLVVIVVADEIVHRVVRKEILELTGCLCRQGFVR